MTQIQATIGDFSILPITIPPLPSYPRSVIHHIYVRRNAPRAPTEDDSRSLFMINVPVDGTKTHLRSLFSVLIGAGRFDNVTFEDEQSSKTATDALPAQTARLSAHSKKRKRSEEAIANSEEEAVAHLPATWSRQLRRSGGTAVVFLVDARSVERTFKAITKVHKSRKYPTWGEDVGDRVPSLGSQWLRAHMKLTYPDKAAVEESVNAFFTAFNRQEQEAAELAKRLRNEPDEDGFVTVTRGGGRNAPARQSEAEEARQRMVDKAEKKKTELRDFYRFQVRERKKAEQEKLVKQFDDDRKKVEAMRQKRSKFRPET